LSQTLNLNNKEEAEVYSNFINSLRSQCTKNTYERALKLFMRFHNIQSYSELVQIPIPEVEEKIKAYIVHLVNKESSSSFMLIFMAAIKNFFEMNDIENKRWRKLKRFMGEETPKH
jgi:site-specific recombinase XerD